MTDYKQLCAEFVSAVDGLLSQGESPANPGQRLILTVHVEDLDALANRARAALAEPEPDGLPIWTEGIYGDGAVFLKDGVMVPIEEVVRELNRGAQARAVLARWGNHPGSPDSSTLQPVPVSERLPLPGDCDEEGRCWWWYPEVPGKTYGYWAHEDDAVPERALNEQPTHWLPAHALLQPS